MRASIKRLLLGPAGEQPRRIRLGLLRGLQFNVDTSCKSQRLIGFDEREITRHVRRLAKKAVSACDVGANDGWYTLFFASLPNIRRVGSFEPSPDVLKRLSANISLNDGTFANKIHIERRFAGDVDSETHCTLDKVVADFPRPMLLKVDVDGAEMEVFRGSRRTIPPAC